MKPRDIVDLLLLGAIWGASFPFMRVAAPEFGPLALIEIRVAIGALFLLPIFLARSGPHHFKGRVLDVFIVGAFNTALPFTLFAYATVHLTSGFAAILNAGAALWAALVAWVWLGERLSAGRAAGLAIGFFGVIVLVWGHIDLNLDGVSLAILAALGGTLMYGIGASFTKRRLTGVDSLALACGSQVFATLAMLPLAIAFWPAQPVSVAAWWSVLALGVACTGIAYILYFRLIANAGPAKAIAVSYLIPVFGILWGGLFLGEQATLRMLLACAIIIVGVAFATGMARFRASQAPPAGR